MPEYIPRLSAEEVLK